MLNADVCQSQLLQFTGTNSLKTSFQKTLVSN